MNKSALNLFAVVALMHVVYLLAPHDEQRQWFYVLRGVGGALLFSLLMRPRRTVTGLALVACWWGFLEEAQTAVCGIGAYGLVSAPTSGLCLDRFGRMPYLIGGISAAAYLAWPTLLQMAKAAYLALPTLLRMAKNARKGRC